jgi:ribosome biogenesis SPOUT family RNA methylase Rps3
MNTKRSLIATALLLGGLLAAAPCSLKAAEVEHPAPPSALVEHARVLEGLESLTRHPGPVGMEAKALREDMRAHLRYREEVVLPALSLLPRMAGEEATPDLVWAVALGDRVRRDRSQHLATHLDITDHLIAIFAAAHEAGDDSAAREAQDLAAFMLGDAEVDENVTVAVANWLRRRLPAGG